MSFQLVRASDTDIAVWHVDHGHIFVFAIPSDGTALIASLVRDVPEATERAEALRDAALAFATEEARSRKLIGQTAKPRFRKTLGCDARA